MLQIENGHKSETGYREDFCDGKEFSSHPLFSAYVDALQLFFYYDDVEVCNPLGSKAKIHKLGKFLKLCVFSADPLINVHVL